MTLKTLTGKDAEESVEDKESPLYNLVARAKENHLILWNDAVAMHAWLLTRKDRTAYEELLQGLRDAGIKRLSEWEKLVRAQARINRERQAEINSKVHNANHVANDNHRDERYPEHYRDTDDNYSMIPGEITYDGSPLSGFSARITTDVIEKTLTGSKRYFVIEALIGGAKDKATVTIPSSEFEKLQWVMELLGPDATIEAGASVKDRLRLAIQKLSSPIPKQIRYAFTGWHEHQGQWTYLHGGGSTPSLPGIEVSLPVDIQGFKFDPLPDCDPKVSVQHALDLLMLEPASVFVPLIGATWRAALGPSPLTMFLWNKREKGKTLCTSLATQHFAPVHDEERTPASFGIGTGRAKYQVRTLVGDCVYLVDDFRYSGNNREDEEMENELESMIRPQFAGSGRSRMSRDGETLKHQAAIRCTLLITGESLPNRASTRARLIPIEVPTITTDLNPHKQLAAQGYYAHAMRSFIEWLAPQYARVRAAVKENVKEIAKAMSTRIRTANLMAHVMEGINWLLKYAEHIEAISKDRASDIQHHCWDILAPVAVAQVEHQDQQDEATRFVELLSAAIGAGRCHVAGMTGAQPSNDFGDWGWEFVDNKYKAKGERVGWTDGVHVWLLPDVALACVKELAHRTGHAFPLKSKHDVAHRLQDAKLLAHTESSRKTLLVRKRIMSKDWSTLCLRVVTLNPTGEEGSLPVQSDNKTDSDIE